MRRPSLIYEGIFHAHRHGNSCSTSRRMPYGHEKDCLPRQSFSMGKCLPHTPSLGDTDIDKLKNSHYFNAFSVWGGEV